MTLGIEVAARSFDTHEELERKLRELEEFIETCRAAKPEK